MKRNNTRMIVAIIIVIALIVGGIYAIKAASGVNPPFTVIESQSMQHSDESELGIIDTGDMILVKDPSKTDIITFIEGSAEDKSSFGNYGSVIIYKRTSENPVIHRAIIWLNWDSNSSTWNAPSLEKYDSTLWNVNGISNDYTDMSGTLNIILKSNYRTISISINLDNLQKHSGYVTMGDNNSNIDQNSSISYNNLITKDRIKSVAWKEIPWIGSLKLIFNGNKAVVDNNVPNSIPNLAAFVITFIISIISLGYFIDGIVFYRIYKKKIL